MNNASVTSVDFTEINFITDDNLRNLTLLYTALKHPKDQILDLSHIKAQSTLDMKMLKAKLLYKPTSILIFKKLLKKESNGSKFLIQLNQVLEHAMPKPISNAKQAARFQSEIKIAIKKNDAHLIEFFNSVYGFRFPKHVTVLLSMGNKTKSGVTGEMASMLVDTPPLICININISKRAKAVPIINLVHELLHAIIYNKKLLDYNVRGAGMFEELLIRYTTESILLNRLSPRMHKSIDECYMDTISHLSNSGAMALRIKGLMERYEMEYGKRTIWAAIDETPLRKMFGMRPPGAKSGYRR